MADTTLIIGGDSGIGRACAIEFADHKKNIVIAGRDKNKLKFTSNEIKKRGTKCSYVVVDIKHWDNIKSMMETLKINNQRVSVLINSAGINVPNRNIKNMDHQMTESIVSTNLTGAINLSCAIVGEMRKNHSGTIVHIGSSAGVRATQLSGVAYSATKRALFSLVRSINIEEAKNGIRASIIAPATVNTSLLLSRPKVPTKEQRLKVLQPSTVAKIAYFIANQPRNVIIEQVLLSSSNDVEFL